MLESSPVTVVTSVVADRERDPGGFTGLDHPVALKDVSRHHLFCEHGLAGFGGSEGGRHVQVVRQEDGEQAARQAEEELSHVQGS